MGKANSMLKGKQATEEEIIEFEDMYNIKLPYDIKEYFLKINGVWDGDGFMQLSALSEWYLIGDYEYSDELKHLSPHLDNADEYFRFGSYDIGVWDWLIRLDKDPTAETPIIVTVQYQNVIKVANSLIEFLHQWRTDSAESLLRP